MRGRLTIAATLGATALVGSAGQVAALVTGVPIELGRQEARDLALRELADPVYAQAQPSVVERVLRWVLQTVSQVLDSAAAHSPGGLYGLLGLLAVIALVIVAVRRRVGPVAARRRRDPARFGASPTTAEDHRRAAERLAAAGRWDDAVRERLRAVVTSLEERGVLDPRPGRTAHEAAADAGRVLPDARADLAGAARAFDEVWFGGRPADARVYAAMVETDRAVGAARAVVATP